MSTPKSRSTGSMEPTSQDGAGSNALQKSAPRRNASAAVQYRTRAAAPAARAGAVLARLYVRAGRADDAQGLPCAVRSDRVAGQDAIPDTSAHAAAWLRLCPSQRRPRHTGAAGLARPQKHPAHGALHRAGAGQVQELLAIGDLWR